MLNNQPLQALQSLIGGGGSAPVMGGQAAAANTTALSGGKPGWGFNKVLNNHLIGLDKDGQKEFLKSFNVWDDNASWDGTTWINPNQKPDPDAKTDKPGADTTWLDDVQTVRDKGPTGLSDAMKKNIGYGQVTPGMNSTTGLVSSGMTRFMGDGDPTVAKPKPRPLRPDETGMRPNFPEAKPRQAQTAMQGTGMSEMLAKLIGG